MSTQEARNLIAARRTKKRRQGVVVPANGGPEVHWSEMLEQVARVRLAADELELEAVTTARVAGYSWDRISVALGGRPTGERLRQKYARAVSARSHEAPRRAGAS
jgi:hypothetical protein